MSTAKSGSESMPMGLDERSLKLALNTVRDLRKKLFTKENILEWTRRKHFPKRPFENYWHRMSVCSCCLYLKPMAVSVPVRAIVVR